MPNEIVLTVIMSIVIISNMYTCDILLALEYVLMRSLCYNLLWTTLQFPVSQTTANSHAIYHRQYYGAELNGIAI